MIRNTEGEWGLAGHLDRVIFTAGASCFSGGAHRPAVSGGVLAAARWICPGVNLSISMCCRGS
jgi:hypothetical protein